MILRELSEAIGVSGDEQAVRDVITPNIREHVSELHVDVMGNLTATQASTTPNAPRILIAAHMDEIGFMVTGFESDGLIRFTKVGGVDPRILPAQRVLVGKDHLPGVILATPIHQNADLTAVKIASLRIDVGASSKADVSKIVKRGDRIVFDSKYMEIGDQVLRGKAFDDRVGCALLVDLIQAGPYPVELGAAFTVQEEIGVRGATVAVRRFDPHVAIALEAVPSHDIPDPNQKRDDIRVPNPGAKLGHGPSLTLMDKRVVAEPNFLRFIRHVAETNNIPYQFKTLKGGGTDAGAIHTANEGIPSSVISVPCRYIHSPSAYLRRDDYQHALQLLQAVLHALPGEYGDKR